MKYFLQIIMRYKKAGTISLHYPGFWFVYGEPNEFMPRERLAWFLQTGLPGGMLLLALFFLVASILLAVAVKVGF